KGLTPSRAGIIWPWEGCALTPSPTTYPPILTSGRLTSFWTGTTGGGPPPHGLNQIYRRRASSSPPNFPPWERTGTIPLSLPAAPNRFKQIRFCDRVCFFHIPFSQEADMFQFFNSVSLTLFQQVNTAFRKTGVNPVFLTTINANKSLDMLFGGVADIIIQIAFYIGAVLIIGGILSLLLAYKDENADAQSRAVRLIVIGGALVGFRPVREMAGFIG